MDATIATPPNAWTVRTWIVAAVMATAVSWSVLAIPVQTTDSIVPLLQAERFDTVAAAMKASVGEGGYFRPLRIGQIQALYQLANGTRFTLVLKAFHVLLVAALFGCFVTALRVRTGLDFAVATFAMTVLTGHQSFLGTVWEGYPFNHFLEIGVFCLFALVLARSRGGWWVDLLAALTFAAAALTLESGLLVWVVLVAAWLAGWRGVSAWGLVAASLLLCGYGYFRFVQFATTLPALSERESGFWTERLSTGELQRRFGDNPLYFYAYNVTASILGVLFAEPRAGVFTIPAQWGVGARVHIGTWVNVVTASATTAFVALALRRQWRPWFRGTLDDDGRLIFVALAVIGANAAISYGYTKDEIMSPAGAFYALAAFGAVRQILRGAGTAAAVSRRHVVVGLVLVMMASGWVVRSAGVHYKMRWMAYNVKNDWVGVDAWLAGQESSPQNDAQRRIVRVLRDDALSTAVAHPFFLPAWAEELFQ